MEKIILVVDKWLKDVEEFDKDVKWEEFIEENIRKKDKCCFGLLFCNMIYCYNISKKVIEKVEEVYRKFDKIKEYGLNLVIFFVGLL